MFENDWYRELLTQTVVVTHGVDAGHDCRCVTEK